MTSIPTFKTPEDKRIFDQAFTAKLAEYRSYFLQTAKELLGYWDADALTTQQLDLISSVTSNMLYAAYDELKKQCPEYEENADDFFYSPTRLKEGVKQAMTEFHSEQTDNTIIICCSGMLSP
jgi:hypothetical protein